MRSNRAGCTKKIDLPRGRSIFLDAPRNSNARLRYFLPGKSLSCVSLTLFAPPLACSKNTFGAFLATLRSAESRRVYTSVKFMYTLGGNGEVQEWLNWPLSKSGMGQLIEGSNPSLSARRKRRMVFRSYDVFFSLEKEGFEPGFDHCHNL